MEATPAEIFEEKRQDMQKLNKRLEIYMARMRALEEEHSSLVIEVADVRKRLEALVGVYGFMR